MQLRTQLASTQFATQLNLGHLIHQADNHRGSFRGLGFELRTDAYGTLRGARGVVLSTYGIAPGEPSGDNAGGIALAAQMKTLAHTLNQAAKTHETVQLAMSIGSMKSAQSSLSQKEAYAPALHTALKGMVDARSLEAAIGDAGQKSVSVDQDKVPQLTDSIVAITARAGLAIAAGQDVALLAAESIVLATGADASFASGGQARVHSGQAIGVLGGAIGPGNESVGKGLTFIAARGDVELQAQGGAMQVAAKGDLAIQSRSGHIDWAAAKKITLATAGGARIVIEGGNITVECGGKITVRAGTKSFVGPEQASYALPEFADATLNPQKRKARFALGSLPQRMVNFAGEPYKLFADGALLLKGQADDDGAVMWEHKEGTKQYKIELTSGHVYEVDALQAFADGPANRAANEGYRAFQHEASQKAPFGAEGDAFRRRVSTGKNDKS